ncbi:MAG: ABC transporter substrate-binding protein [Syntrophorhabdales bacterium]|jgi:phospholipid transport system substrate-binding protein
MKIWLSGLALLVALLVACPVFAGVPLDTVKANVTSVLDVLRDPKLRGEAGRKAKEEKIGAAADTLFDFVELSKRTLGLSWNKFTVEQRKEFVRLFETLLRGIYVDRITAYSDEQVIFRKEVPLSETTAEAQSTVVGKSGRVEIDYRVMKEESGWRVYDVVIDGVSLISNYRTQFREILANNPPEKLLETLREKSGTK